MLLLLVIDSSFVNEESFFLGEIFSEGIGSLDGKVVCSEVEIFFCRGFSFFRASYRLGVVLGREVVALVLYSYVISREIDVFIVVL